MKPTVKELGPLSQVTALTPNEIPPDQCGQSTNPSVKYFFEKAFDASMNNEFQAAIKMYKKVIACDSNHFESWINIGICMMRLNMIPEAVSSFDSAIKSNKASFIPYFNKALLFISIRDYNSALQCMDVASSVFPDPPEELQKIRIYSIFKSGKMSSVINLNLPDGKTSPDLPKQELRSISPELPADFEKQKLCARHLTMPARRNTEFRGLNLENNVRKMEFIKDFDTRAIRTAAQAKGIAANDSSVIHTTLETKEKYGKLNKYDWKKYQFQEFFKPKKKLPLDIAKLESINEKNKDQAVLKKIRERFWKIEDKLIEYVVKNIQKCFTEPEYISSSHVTLPEAEKLSSLFMYPEENIEEIDIFMKNLDFFKKFPKEYRVKIYKISSVVLYKKSARIFTQGMSAEVFYCILNGKVSSIIDSEKLEMTSATEYLRYSRSMKSDKKITISLEYGANCTCEEKSYVLTVSCRDLQLVLLDFLKLEIEEKICFMISLPLFKGLDPVMLIPLAWHINKESFKEGEVVLKKNEVPKGLIIIFSGFCGIYTTGHSVRKAVGSEYANIKKRKRKPASFYTGNLSANLSPSKEKSKSSRDSNTHDRSYKVEEKIEYGILEEGDYFGGRVLIETRPFDNESKFTVIAESQTVETLVITKSSLNFLQERMARQLKVVLQKTHDIDCPPDVDPHEMDKNFSAWQSYKKNLIDIIQRSKFVDSKKIEFPYLR